VVAGGEETALQQVDTAAFPILRMSPASDSPIARGLYQRVSKKRQRERLVGLEERVAFIFVRNRARGTID